MTTPVVLFDVLLPDLRPSTLYLYAPGGVGNTVFNFTTQPATRCSSLAADGRTCTSYIPQRIAVIADMGLSNAASVPRLIADAELGSISMLVHAGDLAYDLSGGGGETGNRYMRMMEPVVSRVRYAVCAGNHEYQPATNAFSHFRRRFSGLTWAARRSNSTTPRYYSFNEALVHWVAIDTEFHFYNGSVDQIEDQYAWLRADLAAVNRSITPWVVAFGHKQGWMDLQNFTVFQDILLQNRVNLYFTGHQHNYQRALPLKTRPGTTALVERSCVSGANNSLYSNCGYMASIVVGSAGCREYLSTGGIGAYATGFQAVAYGYGYLTVWNHTHLQWRWKQVANDSGVQLAASEPAIVDEMWLVQLNNTPVVLSPPAMAATAVASTSPLLSPSPSPPTAGASSVPSVTGAAAQPSTAGPAQGSPVPSASPTFSPTTSLPPSTLGSALPSATRTNPVAASAVSTASASPTAHHTTASQLSQATVLLFLNASIAPSTLVRTGNHTCTLLRAVSDLLAWPIGMISVHAIGACSVARIKDVQFTLLSYSNSSGCRMSSDGSTALLLPSPQPVAAAPAARRLEFTGFQRQNHQRSRKRELEGRGEQRLLQRAERAVAAFGSPDGAFVAESAVDDSLWQSTAAVLSSGTRQTVTVLQVLVTANESAVGAAPATFASRLQNINAWLVLPSNASNAGSEALSTFATAVAAISGIPTAVAVSDIVMAAQISANFSPLLAVGSAAPGTGAASAAAPSAQIPHVAIAVGTVVGCLVAVGLWVAVDFMRKRRHRQRISMAVKRRLSVQAVDPKSATHDSLQWGEQMDSTRRTTLQSATTRARSSVTALSNPMHAAVAARSSAPPMSVP